MDEGILIYDPMPPRQSGSQQALHALDRLNGKVVGFIDNGKPNFKYLIEDLSELLVKDFGVTEVVVRSKFQSPIPAPEAIINELAEKCDAVITGSGD